MNPCIKPLVLAVIAAAVLPAAAAQLPGALERAAADLPKALADLPAAPALPKAGAVAPRAPAPVDLRSRNSIGGQEYTLSVRALPAQNLWPARGEYRDATTHTDADERVRYCFLRVEFPAAVELEAKLIGPDGKTLETRRANLNLRVQKHAALRGAADDAKKTCEEVLAPIGMESGQFVDSVLLGPDGARNLEFAFATGHVVVNALNIESFQVGLKDQGNSTYLPVKSAAEYVNALLPNGRVGWTFREGGSYRQGPLGSMDTALE